jgi:uncharacterized membrane protein YphA (DoxX/SURF4 family)
MADQRIERLKEQIKYETEILKALILVAFATVGGSASLLLGAATQARAVLVGIGLLIALAAVVGITGAHCPDRGERTMTGYDWFTLLSIAVMAGSLIVVILKITSHK